VSYGRHPVSNSGEIKRSFGIVSYKYLRVLRSRASVVKRRSVVSYRRLRVSRNQAFVLRRGVVLHESGRFKNVECPFVVLA